MVSAFTTIARFVRPALLVGAVALAAACGSDNSGTTGPGNVSGTYALDSVSGSALPYTVPNSSRNIIIASATATLLSSGDYSVIASGSANDSTGQIIGDQGTYTVSGSTISFHSTNFGQTYTATSTSTSYIVTIPGLFLSSSNTSFALKFVKSN